MNCRAFLRVVGEFVDGELDLPGCRRFRQHMATCLQCRMEVWRSRAAARLAAAAYESDDHTADVDDEAIVSILWRLRLMAAPQN